MSYDVLQTKRFGRQYKKLNANVVLDVNPAVTEVAETPSIGERRKVIWLTYLYINFVAKTNAIYSVRLWMMDFALYTCKQFHPMRISIVI